MNITFLIGNGFDIGLGLQTGYSHFYEKYCVVNPGDNLNIKNFKELLSQNLHDEKNPIIDWSDFEKAFGRHSNDFTKETKSQYIERFENFVLAFNTYLEGEGKQADFSKIDQIAQTMKKAVTTYFYIQTEDKDAIQAVYNKKPGNRVYNFVSFNYTDSIDKSAQILKKHLASDRTREVGKILHIHGFVEENMIMGVNDATQIANPELANDPEIMQEIVKPIQNANVRANYEKQVTDLITTSDIICIYGMSIGETDKKWWELLANWLQQDEQHSLVILKHDKKYNKRFPFLHIKTINEVIDNFLSFSTQHIDVQNHIRDKIYVGMNHDVFEMNLRKEVLQESEAAAQLEYIKVLEEIKAQEQIAELAKAYEYHMGGNTAF